MPTLHNISDFLADRQQFAELLGALASQQSLQTLWMRAVTDQRSQQCCASSLDESGTLIVLVPDAMFAARLRLRTPEIVAKLTTLGLRVSQLKIRINLPQYTSKPVTRITLSATGQRHLHEMRRMLQ